jgi:hypothetical protein
MSEFDGYYYGHQLRNYLVQFMAIFANMEVEVGKLGDVDPRLIKVPIKNGSSDRVVADIKSAQTQNKPIRLPLMSANLTNVVLAPQLRKGVGQVRRKASMPTGGEFPTDIKIVRQRMPNPYVATFDLGIWASNQDQHYQIIEQILMLFDPVLHIQTSDDVHDWTRLTTAELVGINFEENPPGADRRLIQTTLNFEVPIWISAPVEVHNKFVQDIFVRVGAVSRMANTSEDIIADLDSQGITYEHVFSLDDIDISGGT